MVADLPHGKRKALSQMTYGSFVVAGLFTDELGSMVWDDIYALATPGAEFCMLFNPANASRNGRIREPGGALVVYAAGDRAIRLLPASDDEVSHRYLNSLGNLFPSIRGIVSEVIIQRWPLGVPIARPGRASYQAQLAASVDLIHFAGDYLYSTTPGIETAIWSGVRAARSATSTLQASRTAANG